MSRPLLYVLVSFAVATSASADTVLLANGNRFDNVIARRDGDMVRVRFSYGEIGLPAKLVLRVDRPESTTRAFRSTMR